MKARDPLSVSQLKHTGSIYDTFIKEWTYFGKAFRAGQEFIQHVLKQHDRESTDNFNTRLDEAFNFAYCQNIVTIYNFFLTEKKPIRQVDDEILNRDDWQEFQKNCDLYGTDFDVFLNDTQKLSGAYGTAGVLVDMPPGKHAKGADIYPYLSSYTPNNILDWEFERDFKTRRPVLTYLKLQEGDRTYLIWTPEYWQRYQLDDYGSKIELFDYGVNRIGIVPFVFLPNVRDSRYFYLGVSDICDAAYINAAVTRTLSMGNEVMKMAGFPMLLYPMQTESQYVTDNGPEDGDEVIVGEDAVLPFDPDAANGKPAWLESPVNASTEAILSWLDRITEEMYRAANLAGLHQNRDKAQTKSTTYLRYQFQQTNAVLSKKAESMNEAERMIYRYWAKWMDIDDIDNKISVTRSEEFNIDALQIEIENMVTAMDNVMSDHFKTKIQCRLAKAVYPDLTEQSLNTMIGEIENKLKDASVKPESGEADADDDINKE